ncbi:hypothetical protein Nepgr_025823 [Nepenthes gracilis]|uniref:Uncharacterized protein n=1 Tax=Nepenthes gracilis TaxID=150966 RepID=A0AAD3T6Q5_NEPGR|nr:hypothetical protein Nepgr_025823 [Nepenthes gracilis]
MFHLAIFSSSSLIGLLFHLHFKFISNPPERERESTRVRERKASERGGRSVIRRLNQWKVIFLFSILSYSYLHRRLRNRKVL